MRSLVIGIVVGLLTAGLPLAFCLDILRKANADLLDRLMAKSLPEFGAVMAGRVDAEVRREVKENIAAENAALYRDRDLAGPHGTI